MRFKTTMYRLHWSNDFVLGSLIALIHCLSNTFGSLISVSASRNFNASCRVISSAIINDDKENPARCFKLTILSSTEEHPIFRDDMFEISAPNLTGSPGTKPRFATHNMAAIGPDQQQRQHSFFSLVSCNGD